MNSQPRSQTNTGGCNGATVAAATAAATVNYVKREIASHAAASAGIALQDAHGSSTQAKM